MIKTSLVFVALSFLLLSTMQAQDFRVGGGFSYGTVAKNLGINFRGDIRIDETWSVTPHFNWFFNRESGPITHRWNALNIDGHYHFEIEDGWTFYPLLGINLSTVSEKVSSIVFSNSYLGANLGIGTAYDFDHRFSGFGELKYVISEADQAVFTFGVLYQINR